MVKYLIVIESGYKTTSANYHIVPTEPMELEAARELFAALRAGTSDRLPAQSGATVVDVSDHQFLRVRSVRSATVLDRVTLGLATSQAGTSKSRSADRTIAVTEGSPLVREMHVTQYIGVDLAWGEGTPTRRANETGLALIDEHGTVLDAGWARGIDAVTEWILRVAQPGAICAIDAPLVVPNATGMRLAERQVGMGYGRWKVAANASNQRMGWQGGVALRTRLEEAGFVYASGIIPAEAHDRTFFECYPYTTLVGMTELGFDDQRPRYKRLDTSLPVALARQQRARACDDLIGRMSVLTASAPPLDIASHSISRQLVDAPSPIDDVPYKHREDLLDALLCAWTAAIWHQHGDARTQVLGEDDEPDAEGRVATIIAPARPEQRVRGRPMRDLRSR